MFKRFFGLLIVVVLLSTGLVAHAQEETQTDADTVILTVNGTEVTVEEYQAKYLFELIFTTQLAQIRYRGLEQQAQQFGADVNLLVQNDAQMMQWINELQSPTVLGERVLNDFADSIIIQNYAEENDISITDEDIQNLRNQFFGFDPSQASEDDLALYTEFVDTFENVLVTNGTSLEQLEAFFAEQALRREVRNAVAPDTFTFADSSHILVATEEEALAVIDELENGADFATLAQERSLDTGSAQQGGSLGNAPVLNFVEPFADAVANGELNTVLDPVETQFGFHVIIVNSREEVSVEDAGENVARLQDSAFGMWVIDQIQAADIVRNENWADYVVVPDVAPIEEDAAAETTPEAEAQD